MIQLIFRSGFYDYYYRRDIQQKKPTSATTTTSTLVTSRAGFMIRKRIPVFVVAKFNKKKNTQYFC